MDDAFDVAGKTVVVTGGSRGIGRMIAETFTRAGAEVIIASRNATACSEAAEEIGCQSVTADLSSDEGAAGLVEAVAQRVERLAVLVNNAGATWGAPIAEFPDAAWDKVMNLNVKGPFHVTRRFLPLLEAAASPSDPARVINISSVGGVRVGADENYPYTASKAALDHLTRHLARMLAARSITVNAIAPGLFPSKMTKFMTDNPAFMAAVPSQIPLGRIGQREDIGGVAQLLASRAGAYITGAVIAVDGGLAL